MKKNECSEFMDKEISEGLAECRHVLGLIYKAMLLKGMPSKHGICFDYTDDSCIVFSASAEFTKALSNITDEMFENENKKVNNDT